MLARNAYALPYCPFIGANFPRFIHITSPFDSYYLLAPNESGQG